VFLPKFMFSNSIIQLNRSHVKEGTEYTVNRRLIGYLPAVH
jgi:hypothetical protein